MGNGNNNGDRNMATKTRTIAGHTFTLTAGETYLATRPMAGWTGRRGPENFIVTISTADAINPYDFVKTRPLSYDNANTLINDFNNTECSWEGRVW
jgi:hypothetical protein